MANGPADSSDRPSGGKPPGGSANNDAAKDEASVLRMIGAASGVGFEFIATVLLPGGLGYWLDGHFGTRPWLMIALGVVGFAVGLYRMLKTAKATTG